MFRTMAAFRRYSKNIKLHKSILRSITYNNKYTYYKHHHRLLHLNILQSRRINLIHNHHLRKFWKKYTILISLSAVGLTVSNKYSSTSSLVSADNDNETKQDEQEQITAEEEEEDKKAFEHLIETISVPKHNLLVWLWLYICRFNFLVYNFTPMLLLAPFAYWNIFGIRAYWLDLMHRSFANGGSTFIKIGQWISMRSDLFPIEICEHLSELRFVLAIWFKFFFEISINSGLFMYIY